MRTRLGKLVSGGLVLGLISLGVVGVNSASAARNGLIFGKLFGAPAIPMGGTTTLTFNFADPGGPSATGMDFNDTMPAGLVIVTGDGSTNSCDTSGAGYSIVLTSSTITVTNDALAADGTCAIVVTVQGTAAGLHINTSSPLTSTQATQPAAVASITVVAPPTLSKVFGAATIPVGGTTSLTFTLSNPNTGETLTGVGFTDTLPAGLTLAPGGMTNSCLGALSFAPGSVSLSGVSLSAGSSCTLVFNVRGVTPGVQNNVTGPVTSTEGGTGLTASTSITVLAPPTIAKAFGVPSIASGSTTTLIFTVTNPNTSAGLTGVTFSDTLPAGLTVTGFTPTSTTCPGLITWNSVSLFLSLPSLGAGASCEMTFTVTGTTPGNYTNTTGNVSSTNGGTGGTATATLNVGGGAGGGAAAPPVTTKAFGTASIPLNGTTSMTFTITNPVGNTISLSGIGFTDSLPAGLVISTPNASSNSCGGTLTDTAGSTSVSLTGVTLAHGATCTISVNVTGVAPGTQTNVTSAVSSVEAGPGNTASAVINVVAPPTISKSFSPDSIEIGDIPSTLSFTITNPVANTVGLTGIGFTDALPAGLRVATPSDETGSCGGSVSAPAGSTSVRLSGGTLGVGASCTISVDVTALTAGTKDNVTSAVTSVEGGPGNTASATLVVTEGTGGGGCNSATGSATSDTPGGSATAVNDGTTTTGNNGEGTVTVRGYNGDPVGPPSGFTPTCYFDVSLSPGSTFTSLSINDCTASGLIGLEWWNPAADGGSGTWLPVTGDPGPTLSPGEPSCLDVTLDSTTSPSLSQLGGTVFVATGTGGPPPTAPLNGAYDLVGSDGGVFVFGNPTGFFGSLPGLHISVNNIVGIVPTADARGYFLVGSDGGVFAFGDAPFEGSLPKLGLHVSDIVGIVSTRDDRGYFLVGRDGGVFAFGDASFENSLPGQGIHVNNIVGIAATVDDAGYWLVSSNGTVYALGDASNLGSTTTGSIVSITATPDGGGYWLASASGGVFNYGDALYFNSLPGLGIKVSNIVSLVPSSDGGGYLLIGRDGGVFAFGDAVFPGSLPGLGIHVNNIVGAVPTG